MAERGVAARTDTNSATGITADLVAPTNSGERTGNRSVSTLRPATAGSAGLDLATTHTVTLLDSSVHLLPTGVTGPLPPQTQALLLGRSSTTLSGLFVLPGVIDSDNNTEIQIMAWTPFPPCTVPEGSRIAQLILIPKENFDSIFNQSLPQRQGSFGSTGEPQILWVQTISQTRPICQCTLVRGTQRIVLSGLIDTGADVTVISQAKWPSKWPLVEVSQTLVGTGGSGVSRQSAEIIQVQNLE